MASERSSKSGGSESDGCGCGGCLSVIAFGVLVWFLVVGVSTPWGFYSGDLFPPAVYKHE